MAVSVFADPFGSMQQGRNTDSLIAARDSDTAMNLMKMQQAADEMARNREYIKRTSAPPPEPGKPQDPAQTKSASDMIYSKIGEIDKNIGIAQGLGMGSKVDQLQKERDAMLSRYALAQQREESAKKRVQDQQKENIAEVSKFASSAANILSGSDSPEDKRQQLEALEQAAKSESPDAYKILSRGQPQIDWTNPRTANDMKAFAQQAISPEKKMEMQLKDAQEKRQAAKDEETKRRDDALIAHMREGDKRRDEPKLAPGMKWGDAEHTYQVQIPVGAPGKPGDPNAASPEDAKDEAMAWDYLIRGHNPPARSGAYDRAMSKVAEIAKRNGMSTEELISASADVKTKLQAKHTFEVRTQNLSRAENQLELEIPVMEDAMKKLDLPSLPIAARGNIAILRSMGNPDVTTLDQAAEAVFREYEGIVTGNPGILNIQDVQNAHNDYLKAQTPQQMKAAIDGMKRIITNAKKANEKTRWEIMQGIRSSVNPKGVGSGSDGGAEKKVVKWGDLN